MSKSLKRAHSLGDLNGDGETSSGFTDVINRRKKRCQKKQLQQKQQQAVISAETVNAYTAAIDAVVSQTTTDQQQLSLVSCDDETKQLRKEVDDLRSTVIPLQKQMSLLQSRFDAMEKKLTLSGALFEASSVTPVEHTVVTESEQGTVQLESHSDKLKKEFLTAVYVDLDDNERRKKNIVVFGFPESTQGDDKWNITSFLRVEFLEYDDHFNVVRSRRFGKQAPGRPSRPLLVTFETVSEAQYFVHHARFLRRSTTANIHGNVYINADLTPSQARAAYEVRCKQRARRAKQSQIPASNTGASDGDGDVSTLPPTSLTSSSTIRTVYCQYDSSADAAPPFLYNQPTTISNGLSADAAATGTDNVTTAPTSTTTTKTLMTITADVHQEDGSMSSLNTCAPMFVPSPSGASCPQQQTSTVILQSQ
jgi:hypothetical protein